MIQAASYSRLAAFADCPRRYHEVQVLRRWPEPESEALRSGKEIHDAFARALRNGSPLPPAHRVHDVWIQKVKGISGTLLIEDQAKWAINVNLKPTPWRSDDAWLRVIADAAVLNFPVGCAIDWKTGKRENQKGDLQLVLIALVMFAHFPELKAISASYIWLNEGKETQRIVKRDDAPAEWQKILPQILEFQQAHVAKNFPPKPNRFCKSWCSVRSCEHWGK